MKNIGRLGLHARKLSLKNPLNNEIMDFVCNEDPIFKKVFDKNFVEIKPKTTKKEKKKK